MNYMPILMDILINKQKSKKILWKIKVYLLNRKSMGIRVAMEKLRIRTKNACLINLSKK